VFYNSPSGLILNCFRSTHAQCKHENQEVPSELSHFMYIIDRLLTFRQTPDNIQGNGQNITHLHIQLPLLHAESDFDYL
jgi:hypothetical protein